MGVGWGGAFHYNDNAQARGSPGSRQTSWCHIFRSLNFPQPGQWPLVRQILLLAPGPA